MEGKGLSVGGPGNNFLKLLDSSSLFTARGSVNPLLNNFQAEHILAFLAQGLLSGRSLEAPSSLLTSLLSRVDFVAPSPYLRCKLFYQGLCSVACLLCSEKRPEVR
jgi:hypothetical protein